MKVVAVARAANYENSAVEQALDEVLRHVHPAGLGSLVRPGQRVALKVNMLMGKNPDRVVTTHPAVVRAVCLAVQACGATPLIIDSPGGPYTATMLKMAYEKCGFSRVAAETGAILNFDTAVTRVSRTTRTPVSSENLLAPAVGADVLINLPKLKTHGLTVMTCAVKNMFGLVPGLTKIEYHMRMPELRDFCAALVGIAELVPPELTIVDAIVAMEGEGPSGGKPLALGYLLAGQDMHSVDIVAATIFGLKPEQVPTIAIAQSIEPPLAPQSLEEISLVGDPIATHKVELPVAASNSNLFERVLPRVVARRLARYLQPGLRFSPTKCTACGVCVQSCPPKALTLREHSTPELKLEKCIRCFCCQELCPETAVEIRRPLLARLLSGL